MNRKVTDVNLAKTDRLKRLLLIEERGHRCESCRLDTWLNQKIILTLDHIDGNPDNGNRENLQLLCWNCHAQTPTFGGKNVGKVKTSKRKVRQDKYRGKTLREDRAIEAGS